MTLPRRNRNGSNCYWIKLDLGWRKLRNPGAYFYGTVLKFPGGDGIFYVIYPALGKIIKARIRGSVENNELTWLGELQMKDKEELADFLDHATRPCFVMDNTKWFSDFLTSYSFSNIVGVYFSSDLKKFSEIPAEEQKNRVNQLASILLSLRKVNDRKKEQGDVDGEQDEVLREVREISQENM